MTISNVSGISNASLASLQPAWTSQEQAQLKALVDQGTPLNQIAQTLKRPMAAIKMEAATLRLNLRAMGT